MALAYSFRPGIDIMTKLSKWKNKKKQDEKVGRILKKKSASGQGHVKMLRFWIWKLWRHREHNHGAQH